MPNSLKEALENWDYNYTIIKQLKNEISSNDIESFSYKESDLIMLPPSQTHQHSEIFTHLSSMLKPQENYVV